MNQSEWSPANNNCLTEHVQGAMLGAHWGEVKSQQLLSLLPLPNDYSLTHSLIAL